MRYNVVIRSGIGKEAPAEAMNLQQMQYVLAVAKYHSFSLAAESCYISQSSLSQQISNLERELGVRLFRRTTRNIQITEEGETFLEAAGAILHNVDALEQKMLAYSGLLCGTINIGVITALERIHFSDLAADFYSRFPNLTLNIYQDKSISLLRSLDKREIDIAFVTLPNSGSYPNIRFEEIGRDEYLLVVPDNHPLAGRHTVDLADFAGDRFIFHHPTQAISELCMQACLDAGFTPNIVCRSGASSISLNLIRAGIGIGFFPSEDLAYYHIPGITQLRLSKPFYKKIVMATSMKSEQTRLVSTFIDFIEARTAGVRPPKDDGTLPILKQQ